jgi:hypothetical protein
MDPREAELYKAVHDKTLERKLAWEGTATPDRFIAPLGGDLSVSIYKEKNRGVRISVVDSEDQTVVGTWITTNLDFDAPLSFDQAVEMHERARRSALRTDEKVASALDALKKL